jgi:serine/threonine protein kinase
MLHQHLHIAIIRYRQTDRSAYLKFTKYRQEVEILQHLTSVKSLTNHSVSPVCFWTIDEGTIFSMPDAGGWVTSTQNLESNLFSVAQQLIEGVAFMHEHGVAHLDLKPENIIVDSSTGQLSIIDYSISQRVSGTSEMLAGFAGTPGHVAPEVGDKPYSPIRADLLSCVNVLRNLSSPHEQEPTGEAKYVGGGQVDVRLDRQDPAGPSDGWCGIQTKCLCAP